MGDVMMKIWRYVPIIIIFLLCGAVAAEEIVLTASGATLKQADSVSTSCITDSGSSGIAILASTNNPDDYSINNRITVDPSGFDLSSDSCGGTEKQITHGNLNHVNARVSYDKIVFEEWQSGISSIVMYDIPSEGITPVYPGMQQQTSPDLSGNVIVYEQAGVTSGKPTNVYGYDLKSQTGAPISASTSSQNQPVISGRYVAWQDWRSGNPDIYMADLNTGTVKAVSKNLNDQKNPDISGSLIVWEDWRNGNADIYLYDIRSEKEYQLTSNPADQTNPRISGNIVVWQDNRNGISEIFGMTLDNFHEYQLSDGKGKAVNPDVSGPIVVWEDWKSGNADIYLLDLVSNSVYRMTSNQADQTNPSIFGPNLVWQDKRTGTSNIFLYTFSTSVSPVSSGPGQYQLYGSVNLNGVPAPKGTVITALIDGVVRSSETITEAGIYGSEKGPFFNIPLNSGDVGKTITFRINDYQYQDVIVAGTGSSMRFDLTGQCTKTTTTPGINQVITPISTNSQTTSYIRSYSLSGNVLINGKAAPVGTVISAVINNQIRAQANVNSAGSYQGLNFNTAQNDAGSTILFTASAGGNTYQASQQISVGQQVSGWYDLTFGSTSPVSTYTFQGQALIDGQNAPVGTVISAVVDNQIRGQVTISSAGQYSSLRVPVYDSDSGKYLSFTANWNAYTYSASERVPLNSQQGNIIIASAGTSSDLSKRLDLNFLQGSQSEYSFWGQANIDGSMLPAGSIVYALIDNQVRGQITTVAAGSYGSQAGPYLDVPISSADIGKTIKFRTGTGAETTQSQLVVAGQVVQKSLNFISKLSSAAEFTASPTQGPLPLTVKFTDKSSGSPKSWYWDFGDGTTSSEKNPSHTYNSAGIYSVGLMVTYWDSQTKSVVKQNIITAGTVTPPEAQITLNPGWNFISVPKMLVDGQNTAKSLFGQIDVGGHSIFTYNPRTKNWNTISATTIINPLDAVWIYSTKTDAVYLYFASDALQIPPTRMLIKGWNTFGVTSLNTVPANNALLSVKDKWVYVIGFDSKTQRYQGTIMNVPESSTASLYPGYGYWIYMTVDGDLAAIGI